MSTLGVAVGGARVVIALAGASALAACGAARGPGGTSATGAPVTVYVANSASDTVTPISAATNRPGRPIRVGSGPEQIVISPDGRTAYVAGHRYFPLRSSRATLTVIRTATSTVVKILPMCLAGPGDDLYMAVTPDGKTLYYLCASANRVIPVRTRTLTAGPPINAGPYPDAIAITPDGATAYIANGSARTVTPVSTATNTPGRPIRIGVGPDAIAITPDGTTAYVVTPYATVPVITATNKPAKPINSAGGHAVAITPDGTTAYVLTEPGYESAPGVVVPINVATNVPGHPIKVGKHPWRIAITPDGTMAYVTNLLSDTVTPIRVASGTAGRPIRVTAPFNLVISPDGRTVYVVDWVFLGMRGWVTPISVATGRAGTPIPVGRTPIGIAVDRQRANGTGKRLLHSSRPTTWPRP